MADPPVRHLTVGISADALIQQWARQEGAPSGAAVVVDTEIAARRRGGVEWRHDDAVAVAVLARPTDLDPAQADLAWVAAGLGAAIALDELVGGTHRCTWPDGIEVEHQGIDVAVAGISTLGPGQVDHAALVVRLAPVGAVGAPDAVATRLVSNLRAEAEALDESISLLDRYRERSALVGRDVDVRLLPMGTTRGRVAAIDETAALVVESPTGLQERISIGSVRSVEVLPGCS